MNKKNPYNIPESLQNYFGEEIANEFPDLSPEDIEILIKERYNQYKMNKKYKDQINNIIFKNNRSSITNKKLNTFQTSQYFNNLYSEEDLIKEREKKLKELNIVLSDEEIDYIDELDESSYEEESSESYYKEGKIF